MAEHGSQPDAAAGPTDLAACHMGPEQDLVGAICNL